MLKTAAPRSNVIHVVSESNSRLTMCGRPIGDQWQGEYTPAPTGRVSCARCMTGIRPETPADGLTRITRGQDTFGEWSVRRSHYVTPLMRVIMATRQFRTFSREYVVAVHYLGADEWTNGQYTRDMERADRIFRTRVASWE